jgi:hypothetical protein
MMEIAPPQKKWLLKKQIFHNADLKTGLTFMHTEKFTSMQ